MTPVDFFRLHGLLIDHPINDGHWHRVPTEDHPKKRNGAYLLDGDRAVCQNWATMPQAVSMRGQATPADPRRAAELARERERRQAATANGWALAARKAQKMLDSCELKPHGYLARKGFAEMPALVMPDDALFVPMRDYTNALVGAQAIRWCPDERIWEKKFMPGMRATGARFVLGVGPEAFLCEGLATGLSIEAALRMLRLPGRVMVCFSAANVSAIGAQLKSDRETAFVVAEHDAPQRDPEKWRRNPGEAGQRAAVASGLPWTMSPTEGFDANDHHREFGLRSLAALLMDLRRQTEPPQWAPAEQPRSDL